MFPAFVYYLMCGAKTMPCTLKMKEDEKRKNKIRRYLNNLYISSEVSEMTEELCSPENKELVEELSDEIWNKSLKQDCGSDFEREEYRREAASLLKDLRPARGFKVKKILSVAASIAAIIAITWGAVEYYGYVKDKDITYTEVVTLNGEKKIVNLPDGTVVNLNSCTRLKYPNRFMNDERRVELIGEAYFSVTKNPDQPFIVKTNRFNVKVLGTKFDVKAYKEDEIEAVSVESGKVQINMPEAMMRLVANEQALINTRSGDYSKSKEEEKKVATWIKGNLRFKCTPIHDVAKELERVYNCKIQFDAGQEFDNFISGEHDNKTLTAVLQSIEYVTGIKYRKENNVYILYK